MIEDAGKGAGDIGFGRGCQTRPCSIPGLPEEVGVTLISSDTAGTTLRAIDPLYKGIVLRQSGTYVVVVGLKEPGEGDGIGSLGVCQAGNTKLPSLI
jgi:hypothetical protein